MGLNLYFQGHSLGDFVYYGVNMNVGKIIEVFVNIIFNARITLKWSNVFNNDAVVWGIHKS